jgi:hypothetical protein
MNVEDGRIYKEKQSALAGVPEKKLVTGSLPALRRLSRLVKRDLAERAARKRRMQKASRKANRRR